MVLFFSPFFHFESILADFSLMPMKGKYKTKSRFDSPANLMKTIMRRSQRNPNTVQYSSNKKRTQNPKCIEKKGKNKARLKRHNDANMWPWLFKENHFHDSSVWQFLTDTEWFFLFCSYTIRSKPFNKKLFC